MLAHIAGAENQANTDAGVLDTARLVLRLGLQIGHATHGSVDA